MRLTRLAICFTCVAILAWLTSAFWTVSYHGADWAIGLSQGRYWFSTYSGNPTDIRAARFRDAPLESWKLRSALGEQTISFAIHWQLGLTLPRIHQFRYAPPRYSQLQGLVFQHTYVLPAWMTVVPPLGWSLWLFIRSRKRPRVGCCARCAYDLTGNDSGVCPECGTLIGATVTPK